MACGKLHTKALPEDFSSKNAPGADVLVQKVRAALNIRFQGGGQQTPTVVWTGRGRGFYDGASKITSRYKAALHGNDLKSFWGDDASALPGKLQEVHLHETAVSWLRYQLMISIPNVEWKEAREQYTARSKACCAKINQSYDVDGLCRAFLRRIQALIDSDGDRISK